MTASIPTDSNVVRVQLSERSYNILFRSSAFADDAWFRENMLSCLQPLQHAIVVCDERVSNSIGLQLLSQLKSAKIRVDEFTVPSGETSKSIEQLSRLWESFLGCKADRKTAVFAVGGGVVGDLVGFAAASYARGLRFVQIPTTLLAMVDSSVGGKTGINLTSAKNIVGAFWQPSLVVIDTQSLDTLPTREYLSGLAEVVKYGMIMDAEFFEYLEKHVDSILARESNVLNELIAQSCRCKAKVVQADERETTGLRAILNYGHTFAHAIEATEGYGKFLHGEAVSIGMVMAGQLACSIGMIDEASIARQNGLLKRLELPIDINSFDLQTLWSAMQNDKKVELGKLGFILPRRIGHVERVEGISLAQIQSAFKGS